jgi:hypothetical protein
MRKRRRGWGGIVSGRSLTFCSRGRSIWERRGQQVVTGWQAGTGERGRYLCLEGHRVNGAVSGREQDRKRAFNSFQRQTVAELYIGENTLSERVSRIFIRRRREREGGKRIRKGGFQRLPRGVRKQLHRASQGCNT